MSGHHGHPWLYIKFVGQPGLQEILCLKKQINACTPFKEHNSMTGPTLDMLRTHSVSRWSKPTRSADSGNCTNLVQSIKKQWLWSSEKL